MSKVVMQNIPTTQLPPSHDPASQTWIKQKENKKKTRVKIIGKQDDFWKLWRKLDRTANKLRS